MATLVPIRLPIVDPYGAPEIFADEISHYDRVGDLGRFVFTVAGSTAEEGGRHYRQMQVKILFPLIKVPVAVQFVRERLAGIRIGDDPPLFPGAPLM